MDSLWVVPRTHAEITSRLKDGYYDSYGVLIVAFYGQSVLAGPTNERVFRFVGLEGSYYRCATDLLETVPEIADNETTFVERRSAHIVFDDTADPDVVHVANCYSEEAAVDPTKRDDDFVKTVTIPRLTAIRGILDGAELIYRIAEAGYNPDPLIAEHDDLYGYPEWRSFKDTLDDMQAKYYSPG